MAKKIKPRAKKKVKSRVKPVKRKIAKRTVKKKAVKRPVKKKISKKPKAKAKKKSRLKTPLLSAFSIKEPEKKKRRGIARPTKETFHIVKPVLLEKTKAEKLEVLKKMDKLKNGELEKHLLKDDNKKSQKNKEEVEEKIEDPEEAEIKDLRSNVQKVKSFMTYFFVIIVFIVLMGVIVSLIGIKDIKDDDTYLIVADHNGNAMVGTLYHIKTKTYDTVEMVGYPETDNPKDLFVYAIDKEKGPGLDIDRVMIINYNSFERLSSTTEAKYDGKTITVDEMTRYFGNVRNIPASMKESGKEEWEIESMILGDWIATYHQNVWVGNEGHNTVLKEYRKNNIKMSPTNGAMFMIKLCPVEKIIEWI